MNGKPASEGDAGRGRQAHPQARVGAGPAGHCYGVETAESPTGDHGDQLDDPVLVSLARADEAVHEATLVHQRHQELDPGGVESEDHRPGADASRAACSLAGPPSSRSSLLFSSAPSPMVRRAAPGMRSQGARSAHSSASTPSAESSTSPRASTSD